MKLASWITEALVLFFIGGVLAVGLTQSPGPEATEKQAEKKQEARGEFKGFVETQQLEWVDLNDNPAPWTPYTAGSQGGFQFETPPFEDGLPLTQHANGTWRKKQ